MTEQTPNTETTENPVAAVTAKAGEALEIIPEIIERIPLSYIFAAVLGGMILGIGIVLLMDDANKKHELVLVDMAEEAHPNE